MSDNQEDRRRRVSGEHKRPRQRRFEFDTVNEEPAARARPPAPLGYLVGDIDETLPRFSDTQIRQPRSRPAATLGGEQTRQKPAPRPATVPREEPAHSRKVDDTPRSRSRPAPSPPVRREHLPATEVAAQQRIPDPSPAASFEHNDRLVIRAERPVALDLLQAEQSFARPYLARPSYRPASPRLTPLPPLVLGMIAVVSIMILLTLGRGSGIPIISNWGGVLGAAADSGVTAKAALFSVTRPVGNYELKGAPSLSPEQIDRILADYGSPATGTGRAWYEIGRHYNIDPAFAIAFFIHESSAATNPAWAGWKPDGTTTHNVGNIICAGYSRCYGRFRDYPSWEEGIEDWYRLIDVEYIQGRGHRTVADVIPVYAPAFENDVQNYINIVQQLVDGWRTQGAP